MKSATDLSKGETGIIANIAIAINDVGGVMKDAEKCEKDIENNYQGVMFSSESLIEIQKGHDVLRRDHEAGLYFLSVVNSATTGNSD